MDISDGSNAGQTLRQQNNCLSMPILVYGKSLPAVPNSPGMPAPSYMISSETIATCLKLVPDDCYEAIFQEMFAGLAQAGHALKRRSNPENNDYRPTIGGDGQRLRASYYGKQPSEGSSLRLSFSGSRRRWP